MASYLYGIGGSTPISGVSHVVPAAAGSGSAHAAAKDQRYDQITFSVNQDSADRLRMNLCGQLSQEVRAATTTGDIQEVKQQVLSGEYRPDASEIAARMLLMKGVES